jgi:hypothetical protein
MFRRYAIVAEEEVRKALRMMQEHVKRTLQSVSVTTGMVN